MRKLIVVVFCFCNLPILIAQDNKKEGDLSKSDNFKLDFNRLAQKKKLLLQKDASILPAYQQLIHNANLLLSYQPVSVMDKTAYPPSGNKHDYMSLAPYWWPNPDTKDGLPYVRKDGEVNPEVKQYTDKNNMPVLCENVYQLALAYYYSNDEKYAIHASKLLEVWFIDTATKMNPHLNYGQAVKGITNGRAEGIIDSRHYIFVIDAIELLKPSKSWTKNNHAAMKLWFADFLHWLENSEIGIDEKNAKNNHGVWFDAQALSMALFADSTSLANKIVLRAADRLDQQMDENGYFPHELARNTSLHYTVFALNPFHIIAQLSEQTNINFWKLQTASGKSLQKGLTTILPYLTKEKEWTAGKQIKPMNIKNAYPYLLSSAYKLNCDTCLPTIEYLLGNQKENSLINLL